MPTEKQLKYWESLRGKKASEETRRKMSEIAKKNGNGKWLQGRTAWNKGTKGVFHHTKETREKMRKGHLGKKNWWVGSGKDNPNWKGGITIIDRLIRNLPEYLQWRSDIFKRDSWTCKTCNKNGCYVTAHHIKSFHNIIKENNIKDIKEARLCKKLWELSNGVTLCEDCHKLTDNYKGRRAKNYERKC